MRKKTKEKYNEISAKWQNCTVNSHQTSYREVLEFEWEILAKLSK